MHLWHLIEELRQLGVSGTLFRTAWELKMRLGLIEWLERQRSLADLAELENAGSINLAARMPFAAPRAVAACMDELLPSESFDRLHKTAVEATQGRIHCFGRWSTDFGQPIDWQLHPTSGKHWPGDVHWSKSLRTAREIGDVKLTWEVARFPHAYHMARAAALAFDRNADLGSNLADQIEDFALRNPVGQGVHWYSSLEATVRLLSWLFSGHVFLSMDQWPEGMQRLLVNAALQTAMHVERYFKFAQKAAYNDHLLVEALALYLVGQLLPEHTRAVEWRQKGLDVLTEQAERQFYPDGAYLMLSHNYHRAALQVYLWAWRIHEQTGHRPPGVWCSAMERSLDFLVAHQNPDDGRLPNYGSNDGAQFHILSTCDFTDFRPTLQAVSAAVRGERIYGPGPWDEEMLWWFGQAATKLPLRCPRRKSVSFAKTGFHVLRGTRADNFACFRCGTVRDRFSQIDMLHLDVWWRGTNVLVDGGSYLYNGPPDWHNHFVRTASHNTVALDGRDQMLHWRRFKTLYWTQAQLLLFKDTEDWNLVEGETFGYRHVGSNCVHRRAVLFAKDNLWVVVDSLLGRGRHQARLHWLAAPLPWEYFDYEGRLTLSTSAGPFTVSVVDENGRPIAGNVVVGQESSPRGWYSRYYGEKIVAPSLVIERTGDLPLTFVSILGGATPRVDVDQGRWKIDCDELSICFRIREGRFEEITL